LSNKYEQEISVVQTAYYANGWYPEPEEWVLDVQPFPPNEQGQYDFLVELDETLTNRYAQEFENLALITNTEADIQVFVKTDADDPDAYNLRVYARPRVEPVFAVFSLVAEGYLDDDDTVRFYSQQQLIDTVKDSMT